MAHTQVLLVKPVKNLGHEGDAVKVKAGYARNYLFPQKLALPVNQSTKRQLEVLNTRRADRLSKELGEAKALAERMGALTLIVVVKTGDDGKLFGAVTNQEIHKALEVEGIAVERHQIRLGDALKVLGVHTVTVKIHPEVTVDLKVQLNPEKPIVVKNEEAPKKKAKKAKAEVTSEETTEAAPAAVEATEEAKPAKKAKKAAKSEKTEAAE